MTAAVSVWALSLIGVGCGALSLIIASIAFVANWTRRMRPSSEREEVGPTSRTDIATVHAIPRGLFAVLICVMWVLGVGGVTIPASQGAASIRVEPAYPAPSGVAAVTSPTEGSTVSGTVFVGLSSRLGSYTAVWILVQYDSQFIPLGRSPITEADSKTTRQLRTDEFSNGPIAIILARTSTVSDPIRSAVDRQSSAPSQELRLTEIPSAAEVLQSVNVKVCNPVAPC